MNFTCECGKKFDVIRVFLLAGQTPPKLCDDCLMARKPTWVHTEEAPKSEKKKRGRYVREKKSSIAIVQREDGAYLCVWNKKQQGWCFPGGKVEGQEAHRSAATRELFEETGIIAVSLEQVYMARGSVDPDVTVFAYRVAEWSGEPKEMEEGCPVKWMTRHEFLAFKSKYTPYYEGMFEALSAETTNV